MYLSTLGLNKSKGRYWIKNFKSTNLPTIKGNEFIDENENNRKNYAKEDRSLVKKKKIPENSYIAKFF